MTRLALALTLFAALSTPVARITYAVAIRYELGRIGWAASTPQADRR